MLKSKARTKGEAVAKSFVHSFLDEGRHKTVVIDSEVLLDKLETLIGLAIAEREIELNGKLELEK
jgi:hypothetical protein